MIYILY